MAAKRPRISSPAILAVFSSLMIIELLTWLNHRRLRRGAYVSNILGACFAFIASVILLRMPLYDPRLSTEKISPPFDIPTSKLRSPEDNLTLWQFLTVSWMAPLISVGSARQLHDEDVWGLSYQFVHKTLHEKFRALRGSFVVRLIKANAPDILITSSLGILTMIASMPAQS